ncbi:MAG: AbrB family transcriptional regulator [Gammaproteobacteria bacterium]|nr:MAG: AbrB family transcriptional regulator [Gammaproteobacteria bacterium]
MQQLVKLSSKGQVTIPIKVRKTLHLKTGDTLAWDIESDGHITVRRVEPIDIDYLSALSGTLSEWNSAEDNEAYRDL